MPGISYLLYGKNGIFKQLRIFGKDNKPDVDIYLPYERRRDVLTQTYLY